MFYISRNIETEVFFTHHDMDKAGTESEVLRRLRQKVEGYCDQEYGYIIQVIASSGPESGVHTERVDIRKEGLFARVKFACITFRPSKNEIMPMVVVEVSEGSILGRVGPAQVLIPQMKLPVQSIRFRPQENAYELTSHDSEDSRTIKAGSIVFCRCFEMRVEMNSIMRIIGTLDEDLLPLLLAREDAE